MCNSSEDEGSDLSPRPEVETVVTSNLLPFVNVVKNTGLALIVKDLSTVKDDVKKYIEAHPDYKNFVFYDCTEVLNQYKAWYSIFKDVQLCYAIKCNPDKYILDLFSTLPGCCFDCASPVEIMECLSRGIPPESLIYANPVKSDASIRFMADHNVYLCTVDSPNEVNKMAEVLGDRASKCQLVIRLWVDDSHAKCPLGSKFGCMLKELNPIMEACQNHNMQVVGFAFHVGSGGDNKDAYEKAIKRVNTAIEMAKEYDFEIKYVDVGGGFDGRLADDNLHNPWLETVSANIHEALNKYDIKARVLSEPGRYFNNYTMDMVCHITNVQERNGTMFYRITEGVDSAFKDFRLSKELNFTVEAFEDGELHKTIFIGESGNPYDVIHYMGSSSNPQDIMLPRLKVGDPVFFRQMGAYTASLSTNSLRNKQQHVYIIHESSLY